jgi:hypothetical protein
VCSPNDRFGPEFSLREVSCPLKVMFK